MLSSFSAGRVLLHFWRRHCSMLLGMGEIQVCCACHICREQEKSIATYHGQLVMGHFESMGKGHSINFSLPAGTCISTRLGMNIPPKISRFCCTAELTAACCHTHIPSSDTTFCVPRLSSQAPSTDTLTFFPSVPKKLFLETGHFRPQTVVGLPFRQAKAGGSSTSLMAWRSTWDL